MFKAIIKVDCIGGYIAFIGFRVSQNSGIFWCPIRRTIYWGPTS